MSLFNIRLHKEKVLSREGTDIIGYIVRSDYYGTFYFRQVMDSKCTAEVLIEVSDLLKHYNKGLKIE